MTKLVFFADNDTTSDAEEVNAAMLKENADQYVFVGDGPYSKSGTAWVNMMKQSFDDKKDKLIFSRGNHDEDESESKQTQEDIEAWFPEAKGAGITDCWITAKQVGNTYVISMDTQDMDREFKDRDQHKFVLAELAKAKALRASGQIDWIIMLAHKPFFTLKTSHSAYTGLRFMYKDPMRDAQVDFMVHGHNHNTQLWLPMIPNQSDANAEGEQLFTKLPDGTFDFTKDHGAAYIVTGHAGHEWNEINDSGGGVANVMHFRDSGKFGYTVIETNGKSAKVLSKDTDNVTTFEYKVTREGGTGPVEPPNCSDPAKCIDPQTGECRPIGINEHKSPTNGTCMPNTTEPTCPPGQYWDPIQQKCVPDTQPPPVVCPRDYHFDVSLNRCIPDLEPKVNPVCPDDYHFDATTGTCILDAPEPGEPFAKLTAPNQVTGGMTVVLDGSQSVGDTVTIIQTAGQTTSLTDIGINKKQFTAPTTGHHTLGFELKAVKGTKQAISQVKIIVTNIITPPPPCQQNECKDVTTGLCRPIGVNEELDPATGNCKPKTPTPTGDWVLDANGIGWSPDTTGETVGIEMSRDETTDDRWSGNVPGLLNGFEGTFIGKSTGTNDSSHFAMKQFGGNHSGGGAASQRWYDNGLRVDGTVQLQWEGPHPNNHDYELPDTKLFIKKISKGLEGNWIGLKWRCEKVKPDGSPADGGVRVRMWVDEDPLDATSNKPKNGWKLVLDFIDGVDAQVINPQDYKAPDEQDCEVRRSDTDSHEIYSNGQIVQAQEGVVGLYIRHLS